MRSSSILTFFFVCASPIYGSASVSPAAAGEKNHLQVFFDNKKRLNLNTISPDLKRMEYAVRGSVVIAADKINDQLQKNAGQFPFDHIVYTNIGNPQAIGQRPLTWPRQVLALVDLPNENGIDHPDAHKLFPADAINRAREIKQGLGGSSGSYSHSKGARLFREDVAHFIENRDGIPADPDDIFLSNGASAAIEHVLKALIADSKW